MQLGEKYFLVGLSRVCIMGFGADKRQTDLQLSSAIHSGRRFGERKANQNALRRSTVASGALVRTKKKGKMKKTRLCIETHNGRQDGEAHLLGRCTLAKGWQSEMQFGKAHLLLSCTLANGGRSEMQFGEAHVSVRCNLAKRRQSEM